MKEIVQKWIQKRGFGIIAICFCFLLISGNITAKAESVQAVWSEPNPTQWHWLEPKTNLTLEQVNIIFGNMVVTKTNLCSTLFFINSVKLDKSGQNIIITTSPCLNTPIDASASQKMWGRYPYGIGTLSLGDIQSISLFYISNSNANNKWLLALSTADSSHNIFFNDENSARNFGDAVASALTQKGFSLKPSKLGLASRDLTPAQAGELGKLRIESVVVDLVAIDGPADNIQIQPLDVITEVNGIKIKNSSHLNSLIEGIASGTNVKFNCLQRTEVIENGQKQFLWKPKVYEMTVK